MGNTPPFPNKSKGNYYYREKMQPFALIGRGKRVARAEPTTKGICAQVAHKNCTELKGVLMRRSKDALTPYKLLNWELLMVQANLLETHPYIIEGLHFGFILGFPYIPVTQTPPNKDSTQVFHREFDNIIMAKFNKGR